MAKLIAALLAAAAALPAPKGAPKAPERKPASVKLEPVAIARIAPGTRFRGTRVGGLSGLAFRDGKVLMLSDDRGKFDPPRVYEAELEIEIPKAELKLTAVFPLKDVPGVKESKRVLDPEGFALLANGEWLVSSEADTNRRPRESNRLMRFSAAGKYLGDLDFPADVQPEPSGEQTRGTANNFGPEGLSACADGSVWTGMELPLLQGPEGKNQFSRWTPGKTGALAMAESHWYAPNPPNIEDAEVIRGVSDLLCLEGSRLLVIERSGKLTRGGLGFGGGLFLADCSAKDCTKTEVLDFARDLKGLREGKPVANFEGLAWGPNLPDGRRSVLLLSDDNFGGKSGTELVVLGVKEAP